MRTCITRLPENGYGANVTTWPSRLHHPPDRLQSIEMDAYISRKEIFKAESKYWNEIITGYVGAFHWREFKLRNVLDMRAGYGGYIILTTLDIFAIFLHFNWMFYKPSPFSVFLLTLKNHFTVAGLQLHCMTLRLIAGL